MTSVHAAPAAARGHPGSMLLLGAAIGLVAADATVAMTTGSAARSGWLYVSFTLAMIGMVVAGSLLLRDPLHAGLRGLLLGVAATGSLHDLMGLLQDVGPLAFLQGFVYWGYAGLLAHVLVRWPDRRIESRVAHLLVLAVYLLLPALTAVWRLTWDARWYGRDAAGWWWPTLLPARDLSFAVWRIQQVVFLVVVAALGTVIVRRLVLARGARRLLLVPVGVVAVALALTVVAELLADLGAPLPIDTAVTQDLALLAIPIAVLVAAVRSSGAPAAPGRRLPPGDPVVLRYRLGLAGLAAALVLAAAVVVMTTGEVDAGAGPAPAPGPALVAP
jgi:hypothetical protein